MKYIYPLFAAVAMAGCSSTKATTENTVPDSLPATETFEAAVPRVLGGKVRAMPFAMIYKTNGDYNDNVTINIDSVTGKIISYPGINDVAADACPMTLIDGWLLDRRGGVNVATTAFLRWTYAEYHELKATPSLAELRAAIIPGARVTVVERLPMTTFDAQADTAAVNKIIIESYRR